MFTDNDNLKSSLKPKNGIDLLESHYEINFKNICDMYLSAFGNIDSEALGNTDSDPLDVIFSLTEYSSLPLDIQNKTTIDED